MSQSPLVFTPLEASNAAEKYVQYRQENAGMGMPLYMPSLEYKTNSTGGEGFMPVLPGETISVLGRPGHAKTGFMFRWARQRAAHLKQMAAEGSETAAKSVVIYVVLEQKVEELRLFHMAAENGISMSDIASGSLTDWKPVTTGLRKLHTDPLWFIGRSMERRKHKTQLNEENIYTALSEVEEWQDDHQTQVIDSVFIDYLQKFRPKGNYVEYFGALMNTITEWSQDFMSRTVVGVQAKREVDKREAQIPLMDDGQWSSTIEQFSDGVLSLVRPCLYPNKQFDGVEVVGNKQLLVSCLKRKLGPANFNGWVNFEPQYNRFSEVEINNYNFRVAKGEDE